MNETQPRSAWAWVSVALFMLLFVAFLFILLKVVPVFAEVYEGFGARLPGPTLFVINLSKFLRHWFVLMFPAIALVFTGASLVMWFLPNRILRTWIPLLTFIVAACVIIACYLPVLQPSAASR